MNENYFKVGSSIDHRSATRACIWLSLFSSFSLYWSTQFSLSDSLTTSGLKILKLKESHHQQIHAAVSNYDSFLVKGKCDKHHKF